MPPARKKGSAKAAAAAAARQHWKVGDLVLAKMKGFPAWPATISEPEKWGFSSDRKKLLVYFYGTKQIAFCNYADVEAFTEEKKKYLLSKRQGKGADFVRAVDEIVKVYEKLKLHSKIDSGDEGTLSSAGNSEISKSNFSDKSPELSSDLTNCHQSEPTVLTERQDLVNPEVLATAMDVDLHDVAREKNELNGTVTIPDQPWQAPSATTTNLRRKLRDSPLQSFATQKRITSIRRCRRPSGHNFSIDKKSAAVVDGSHTDGGDLISDSVYEDLNMNNSVTGEVPHISFQSNLKLPSAACVPIKETTEDNLSEMAQLNSEVINLNDGSVLGFSCKVEYSGNVYSRVDKPNRDSALDDQLETKTVILKKKRKPNRKRVNCAKEYAEAAIQSQMNGNFMESPIISEANERSHSADGDEHLPLVKRARCRMGKLPADATQMNDIVDMTEKYDTPLLTESSGKYTASPSSENTCLDGRISASIKETSASLPLGNCTDSEKNLMSSKAPKYQLSSIPLDAEAALPPSKRLHRALEAMSANTAEATENCSEEPRAVEFVPGDSVKSLEKSPQQTAEATENCSEDPRAVDFVPGDSVKSLEKSPHHHSVDWPVGSPEESDGAFRSSTGRSLTCLSSDNVGIPIKTLLEPNPNATVSENLRNSSNKDLVGVGVDVKDSDVLSNIKMSDKDALDKDLRPCLFSYIGKQENTLSVQSISGELPSGEVMPDQLSHLGEEKLNPRVQPTKESLDFQGKKMSDNDALDKSLQPCLFDYIEKQENTILVQSISDELRSGEVMTEQMLSPSPTVEEKLDQKMQLTKESLDSPGSKVGSIISLRSSVSNGSVSNSKEINSPLPPKGPTVLSSQDTGFSANNSSRVTKLSKSNFDGDNQDRNIQVAAKEAITDRIPKDHGSSLESTPMKNLIAAAQARRLVARSTSFSDTSLDGKIISTSVSPSLLHRDEYSGQGTPKSSIRRISASDDSTQHLQNGSKSSHGSLKQKRLDKVPGVTEANAARKNFEDILGTLSRTKESIGRATRAAIDCAKYGLAGEIIEIILHSLEREASLPRRVDLFFLVDSITQSSRSQKGGAGDVYPPLVQSALSRLLSAAAPAGSSAFENRRQCLKVLRVWLERKSLPESIVRQHMRELEYANEVPFTSSYSRRPSRTERAMDDPLREMEGMLVDEYGSNTSFQMPSFLRPHLFEDEGGSSDDEKSFEAVTPESNVEVDDDKGATQAFNEKHRHVLEDVDGELEMEDLAPPSCAVEVSSRCHVSGGDAVGDSRYHHVDHCMVSYAPPLPEDKPPSPPPLPSSPPPLPSSPSYHCNPSGSHPSMTVADKNNHLPFVSVPMPPNKSYHLPPPPRTVSNQFSYVQADTQRTQSWGNSSSSLPDRFQYVRNNQRGCHYGDRGTTMGPIHHEISDGSRFSSAVPEPSTRWSHPSRPSNYHQPTSRPSLQGSFSRMPGAAPGYWRPR